MTRSTTRGLVVGGAAMLVFLAGGIAWYASSSAEDESSGPSASIATGRPGSTTSGPSASPTDDSDSPGPASAPVTSPAPTSGPGDPAPTDEAPIASAEELLEPVDVVGFDGTARFGEGVTARVESIRQVVAQAEGPGEMSGSALEVTLQLRNVGSEPLDLGAVVVNLWFDSGRTPAVPVTGDPAVAPFEGVLAAQDSAEGVYVFTVPDRAQQRALVTVKYASLSPVVAFRGRVG